MTPLGIDVADNEVKCAECDNAEELGGETTERTLEDAGWTLGPTESYCPDHDPDA